ncbi:MAG TPA: glycosyltransferase family 2 protein [Devosiaceae bacterium]|jgi:dolichol-phosphate mannosyltransferase|nr:glycosyltransferase family 2 protein [Devosiaceae bacterium]
MNIQTQHDLPIGAVPWLPPQLSIIVPTFNERDNVGLLYDNLAAALGDTPFEMIVVDDNSPDGTAAAVKALSRTRPNIRCLQRIGRRGLSSACIEGISASAAPFFAVMDADHQHDERILPQMLDKAMAGDDVVVATRYAEGGSAGEGFSSTRAAGSQLATRLSTMLSGIKLSDPMSGFFLMRREVFDEVAPSLSDDGFKILLDIIVTSMRYRKANGQALAIGEVPYQFRERHAGTSKMSPLIVIQFLGLLLSKMTGGLLPTSFLLFGLVGGTGVVVHLAVFTLVNHLFAPAFWISQTVAALISMTSNFFLNNELTYADKKLRGARLLIGIVTFYAVCSFGLIANVSVANLVYGVDHEPYLAAIVGVVMSVVFNYAVTRVFTWR